LANPDSRLTYLNGKMRYMTVLDSPPTSCKSLRLSTHHSSEFGGFFVFPHNSTLIPCESQGLPTLLAEEGTEYRTEDSFEDSIEHRSKVYVLNFNFTPTPEEEQASMALKIDAFICRYWRQIRSAFGDVGLFAFFLWKTRRKLP